MCQSFSCPYIHANPPSPVCDLSREMGKLLLTKFHQGRWPDHHGFGHFQKEDIRPLPRAGQPSSASRRPERCEAGEFLHTPTVHAFSLNPGSHIDAHDAMDRGSSPNSGRCRRCEDGTRLGFRQCIPSSHGDYPTYIWHSPYADKRHGCDIGCSVFSVPHLQAPRIPGQITDGSL